MRSPSPAPSRHGRDARVYGLTTKAMAEMIAPPLHRLRSPPYVFV